MILTSNIDRKIRREYNNFHVKILKVVIMHMWSGNENKLSIPI